MICSHDANAPVDHLDQLLDSYSEQLRDIWLDHIDHITPSGKSYSVVSEKPPSSRKAKPEKPSHKTLLSPATPTLPLSPPPGSGSPPFVLRLRGRDKASHSPSEGSTFARAQSLPKNTYSQTHKVKSGETSNSKATSSLDEEGPDLHSYSEQSSTATQSYVRVDVLHWLGRATLDVIGLAGFGYAFDALVDDQNILANAFAELFTAARRFRFITVLQAWFPILHHFVSTSTGSSFIFILFGLESCLFCDMGARLILP